MSSVEEVAAGVDELLLVVSTGFILLMQAGFALVENGTVRKKNSSNILIKNLFDACAGAMAFWLLGYGFAFGVAGENPTFVNYGGWAFASSDFKSQEDNHYLYWCFQFSFAATAATIVSGSVAERCHFLAIGLVGFVVGSVLVHVSERQGLLAAEALLALFVGLKLNFT